MIRVIIIEDELPAKEKLERYLLKFHEPVEVVCHLTSVKDSINWLSLNQSSIDLIFLDIQLTDDSSFTIFDKLEVTKPIIFTTAFDEFAIKAFEVNSIAYLLKPITYPDLEKSILKYQNLKVSNAAVPDIATLIKSLHTKKEYKSRFMVKIGEHIRSVTTENIVLFSADGRNAFIRTNENRSLIIDHRMEELDQLLDPDLFFRVNRSFIVNINYIKDVLVYSNSRLRVIPNVEFHKEIIVSREKVAAFKQWFDGNRT